MFKINDKINNKYRYFSTSSRQNIIFSLGKYFLFPLILLITNISNLFLTAIDNIFIYFCLILTVFNTAIVNKYFEGFQLVNF